MVASAGPRPGWSRRAQYGLFFGFVATVAAVVVGLFMLILSLAAPQSYAAVRGAALDVTAPVTNALNEVATTATGLVSGAGDYWNAARQNGELKRQRTRDAAADGRGQGDPARESGTQARAGAARARPPHGRHRARRRLVLHLAAALRDPVGRQARRGRGRHAGARRRRADRPGDRRRVVRQPRPAGQRPRQHRPGAAACAAACR